MPRTIKFASKSLLIPGVIMGIVLVALGPLAHAQSGVADSMPLGRQATAIVDSKYPTPPTVAKVREITEDMLTKNTDVQGIFACNATTAAGALQALRSPGQSERGIKMVGFDAWDSLVEGLKSEEIDSLVIQNPYRMGYDGVKAILANLSGREVPKKVDTGVELVTKDRLGEQKIKDLLNLR